MLVAPVLPHEVEAILIEVQTHEGLHCQDKVSEIVGMLDLPAVLPLSLQELRVELDVLLKAVVHYVHLVVPNELFVLLRLVLQAGAMPWHLLMVCNPVDVHDLRGMVV
jgi:hypothetical protein